MEQTKKATFGVYILAPVVSVVTMVIASFISYFIFNLRGENSPIPVFVIFGFVYFVTMLIYAFLPVKRKQIARYSSMFLIGSMLLILAGILGKQNFQIEGFFFFAFAGAFGGVIIHYSAGKIFGPLLSGRTWCSWGCWTVMLLDLLPYKKSKGWSSGRSIFKYIYFITAAVIVFIMIYGFHYTMHNSGTAIEPLRAMYWFIAGNLVYYTVGILLAFIFKDNRAFCKYLCPASIFLKAGTVFSVLRIKGDASKCSNCGICTKTCPMNIHIPAYTEKGGRVKSTECIMCMKCIAVCPEGALRTSLGIDMCTKDDVIKY